MQLGCFVAAGSAIAAGGHSAFALRGTFIDEFDQKPHCMGCFEARAFGSMVLIDTTLDNGYRELVGTDGRDVFKYSPLDARSKIKNAHNLAFISSGSFPVDATFYSQILWLAATGDEGMLKSFQTRGFHFYGDYRPEEITASIATADNHANLFQSVKWYAPNTMAVGEARYELAMYPQGWLAAELFVNYTNAGNGICLPIVISFTRYKMFAITNAVQRSELHARQKDDVQVLRAHHICGDQCSHRIAAVELCSPDSG